MAKKNIMLELNIKSTEIVSKNFKIGTDSKQLAESITNGFINKLVFGEEEESRLLLSLLVPEIISVDIAKKLLNNIDKYKTNEKDKLNLFIKSLENSKKEKSNKGDTSSKIIEEIKEEKTETVQEEVIKEVQEEKPSSFNSISRDTNKVIANDDTL